MAKKTIFYLVFVVLAIISVVKCETKTSVLGTACSTSNHCSPPYIICEDGTCKHKSLFPMTGWEVGSLFLILGILMISIIVSIAGGVIIVPISVYFMGFSAVQAVSLANFIIVITSFIKYLMSLFRHNPVVPWKTIIDYNGAILLIPTMALFSTIGGIVSSFLPDVLILFMLIVTLILSMYTGFGNLKKLIRTEKADKVHDAEIKHKTVAAAPPAPEPVEVNEPKIEHEEMVDPIPQPEAQPLQEKKPETTNKIILTVDTDGDELIKANSDPQISQNEALIERQKKIEGRNFYMEKYVVIIAVLVLIILVAIFRAGSKGKQSIIGVNRCDGWDWGILVIYIALMSAIPFYSTYVVVKEQNLKNQIGWNLDEKEVRFTKNSAVHVVVFTCAVGFLSSIMGIGGGILLTPFLLKYKYMPVTSSYTININTLLGKVAAVIVNLMAGDLLLAYALFYGGIITVGIVLSESIVLEWIKKKKTQLFYPIAFLLITFISLVFVLYVGIDKWVKDSSKGINVWKFKAYC